MLLLAEALGTSQLLHYGCLHSCVHRRNTKVLQGCDCLLLPDSRTVTQILIAEHKIADGLSCAPCLPSELQCAAYGPTCSHVSCRRGLPADGSKAELVDRAIASLDAFSHAEAPADDGAAKIPSPSGKQMTCTEVSHADGRSRLSNLFLT